jgi:hypothetical protein
VQARVICHALLDIIPDGGLEAIFNVIEAECLRYQGIDPATGFLIQTSDEDPYENAGSNRKGQQAARLLDSILRARPTEPDERKR